MPLSGHPNDSMQVCTRLLLLEENSDVEGNEAVCRLCVLLESQKLSLNMHSSERRHLAVDFDYSPKLIEINLAKEQCCILCLPKAACTFWRLQNSHIWFDWSHIKTQNVSLGYLHDCAQELLSFKALLFWKRFHDVVQRRLR